MQAMIRWFISGKNHLLNHSSGTDFKDFTKFYKKCILQNHILVSDCIR